MTVNIDQQAYDELVASFVDLERDGLLPDADLHALFSSENTLLLTTPYVDIVPVRGSSPAGRSGARSVLTNSLSVK